MKETDASLVFAFTNNTAQNIFKNNKETMQT